MKYRVVAMAAAFLMVAALVLGGAGTAGAQTFPWLKITGGPSVDTCSGVSFGLPAQVDVGTTGSDYGVLSVPGNGTPFTWWENHSVYGPLSGTATYTVVPNPYNVAANTTLQFELTTYAGPNGSGGVTAVSWVQFNCTTGAVLNSYFGDGTYQAVPVPAGFKQYTVTCDSAVYDMPGGTAVGDNMVHTGQAWYLNTTPVSGPDGQNWTEIFVAGVHTGYIPTACVGGPTPFN